jgi:hypothetical protein
MTNGNIRARRRMPSTAKILIAGGLGTRKTAMVGAISETG